MSSPPFSSANVGGPAFLRVALFWVAYLAILYLTSIPKAMAPPHWSGLVWGLLSSVAIFGLTLVLVRREGRTLRDVGVRMEGKSAVKFITGAAIGFAVYGLVILSTSILVGPIRFTRIHAPGANAISFTLGTYLALSVMEELGFRGYTLRTLASASDPLRAQAIVAVAFCLSHAAFGWPWLTLALGVLPSAILFGVAALAAGDLMMPIGLHAAMNVARWIVGETGTPGFWTMAIGDQTGDHAAMAAPLIGFAVTVLCAGALWFWHQRSLAAGRG